MSERQQTFALTAMGRRFQVENLLEEAKYKVYLRRPVTEIDFEEFVKLYLNHRPAFGYNYKKLRNAFRNFADLDKEVYKMHREEFIYMLQEHGERFPRELTWYLLSILCGHNAEDRAVMTEGDFSFLPEEISFNYLVVNIMGIQDMDDLSEYSGMDTSSGSQSHQTTSSVDSEEKY